MNVHFLFLFKYLSLPMFVKEDSPSSEKEDGLVFHSAGMSFGLPGSLYLHGVT